jgi:hypothetical protein
MARNGDNVTHLPSHRDPVDGSLPLPVEELAEVVGAIGRCLAEIGSEPHSGAGFGRVTNTPLLLQMSTVEQRLEKLAEIKVTTWPDVRWALHFSNARVRALTYIRASAASLQTTRNYARPQRTREENVGLAGVGAMSNALQGVRDLIVTRYPQTRQAR